MDDLARLRLLLKSRHPLVFMLAVEEPHALTIVRDAAFDLKQEFWIWSSVTGLRGGLLEDAPSVKDTGPAAGALAWWLENVGKGILVLRDVLAHLSADPVLLRMLRETVHKAEEREAHVILIDHADALPEVLAGAACRFEPSLPDEDELEGMVVEVLRREDRRSKLAISGGKPMIRRFAAALRGLTRGQAHRVVIEALADDQRLSVEDVERAVLARRRLLSRGSALEFVEAPATLDQVGGLDRLKGWLAQRGRSIDAAKAEEYGLAPPRGVMILGVSGAGKSLCAKAIATAWGRPLLRLDPGALYDRYVGESERRLREALRQAEAVSPCVLWIDEIEKGFASAAAHSTDGGLSQRMFGAFLTWMQEHRSEVFLAATANNIEALPPELLRKGRFDEVFFVDLPSVEVRRMIIQIHLKKRKREPGAFDLDALAAASEGFSGAEIEQAVMSALYSAMDRDAELTTRDVLAAMEGSPPLSVTRAEQIDALRAWARHRCVSAD
jgi:ATP-dependent 26S proteasome regulatory subunit